MARIAGFITWKAEDVSRRHDYIVQMLAAMSDDTCNVINKGPLSLGIAGQWGSVAVSGNYIVVLDGQIFNTDELQQTVSGKYTNNAQLILELCRKVGFKVALQKLNGDISLAFFDGNAGRLWLARDRFGIKPLYYVSNINGFGFSSLPTPLLDLPGVGKTLDNRYIGLIAGSHYRTFDNAPERSPFVYVDQLPAAHILEVGPNGVLARYVYWQLKPQIISIYNEDVLAEQYRELLLDAVRRRLAVAGRPAFTLSGGMDSSSVLGCAVHSMGRLGDAFSTLYVDPTYDERLEIQDIVNAGLAHWTPVELSDDLNLFGMVEHLVSIHQEPVATATWLSHDILSRCVAEKGFDSLFGGLGGDELNAGEYEYFPLFFADLRATGQDAQLAVEIARWVEYHNHPIYQKNAVIAEHLMMQLTQNKIMGCCRPNIERQNRYARTVRAEFFDVAAFEPVMDHPFSTYLANRAYQDLTRETAPCCLRAEDRQCSTYGLNHYDPFLDYRLVEFMFAIPGTMKIRNGVTKYLLRKAMKHILPNTTRMRVKKTGWNAPAHRWFSGSNLTLLRDMVASRRFQERGIYHIIEVERIINEHEKIVQTSVIRENHMMFLWQLLNLELWLEWLEKF